MDAGGTRLGTHEHDLESDAESRALPLETDARAERRSVPAAAGGSSQAETATKSVPAPGALPMDKRGIYTLVAHQGVNAAEMLNTALSSKTVGKAPPRRVDVAAPDGPSTDGGKRARQVIRLVPADGAKAGIVICGALDVAHKTLELRTYRNACTQHVERYGVAFDVLPDDYAKLLKELGAMVAALEFRVSVMQDSPGAARGLGAASGTSSLPTASDAPVALQRSGPNSKALWFMAAAVAVGLLIGLLIPAG
jgi:hypothetical protein